MPTSAKTDETHDFAKDAAKGAAVGAGIGAGLWGLAVPAVNLFGFGASGIAAGSTAASMMSAAAVANGGGVAAGSTVAVLQSVGAVGLATPVGLGLVAAGVAVGGAVVGVKSLLTKRQNGQPVVEGEAESEVTKAKEERTDADASWLLLEWLPEAADPIKTVFSSEGEAREAYKNSPSATRMLCRSDLTCVERT